MQYFYPQYIYIYLYIIYIYIQLFYIIIYIYIYNCLTSLTSPCLTTWNQNSGKAKQLSLSLCIALRVLCGTHWQTPRPLRLGFFTGACFGLEGSNVQEKMMDTKNKASDLSKSARNIYWYLPLHRLTLFQSSSVSLN